MSDMLGAFALNLAFILYLIHYFPQLIHNTQNAKLQQVSLHFHGLLGISYLTDLCYGIGMQLPWQYRTVSLIGTICLGIQHCQLMKLHRQAWIFQGYTLLLAVILITFCINTFNDSSTHFFLLMGYVSQITSLIFLLPVIVRNFSQKKAQSLSISYLGLNWLCYGCTLTAAYCLHWPLPSKLGTLFGLLCLSTLMIQTIRYNAFNREKVYLL